MPPAAHFVEFDVRSRRLSGAWIAILSLLLTGADAVHAQVEHFLSGTRGYTVEWSTPQEKPTAFASEVIASSKGIAITTVAPAEIRSTLSQHSALRRSQGGDGVAATVQDLLVVQARFRDSQCEFPESCESPCNVVLLVWKETDAKTKPLQIAVDGNVIGETPPALHGGENAVNIVGLPAGVHEFQISSGENGTTVEGSIEILDAQPFADPEDVMCRAEFAGTPNACSVVLTMQNGGPLPDIYGINLDGTPIGHVAGAAQSVTIPGIPLGDHCFELVGLLETPEGIYRGCFVEVCCEVDCVDLPCDAPSTLSACQTSYGADASNSVRLTWTNRDGYQSIDVLVNGEVYQSLPGNATSAVVSDLPPGSVTIGLQGDCAFLGRSEISEVTLLLRTTTPHTNPIAGGDLQCEFQENPEGTRTALRWTAGDPSTSFDVYVFDGVRTVLVATVPGNVEAIEVTNTSPDSTILLQFFVSLEGTCYGSEVVDCTPAAPPPAALHFYLPAICDGGGSLNLSSSVFLLNFLFLGGEAPPCRVACDCNGDNELNLADAICALNFLFLGGEMPQDWLDGGATCVQAGPEDDCETPNLLCPQ